MLKPKADPKVLEELKSKLEKELISQSSQLEQARGQVVPGSSFGGNEVKIFEIEQKIAETQSNLDYVNALLPEGVHHAPIPKSLSGVTLVTTPAMMAMMTATTSCSIIGTKDRIIEHLQSAPIDKIFKLEEVN